MAQSGHYKLFIFVIDSNEIPTLCKLCISNVPKLVSTKDANADPVRRTEFENGKLKHSKHSRLLMV